MVGWIDATTEDDEDSEHGPAPDYQMIALTYTGGWYRLALPPAKGAAKDSASSSATSLLKAATTPKAYRRDSFSSSASSRTEKGKEKAGKEKQSRDCILLEYRKYGRWDGWG